jgi:hypothetical protein
MFTQERSAAATMQQTSGSGAAPTTRSTPRRSLGAGMSRNGSTCSVASVRGTPHERERGTRARVGARGDEVPSNASPRRRGCRPWKPLRVHSARWASGSRRCVGRSYFSRRSSISERRASTLSSVRHCSSSRRAPLHRLRRAKLASWITSSAVLRRSGMGQRRRTRKRSVIAKATSVRQPAGAERVETDPRE